MEEKEELETSENRKNELLRKQQKFEEVHADRVNKILDKKIELKEKFFMWIIIFFVLAFLIFLGVVFL